MSLNFTDNDLLLLERQRLDRFRSFFVDTLSYCFLHLNRSHTLAIHCTEPWMVDRLLAEVEQLCWYAWVVVGAYHLSIYFCQEEIYTVKTWQFKKIQSRSVRAKSFQGGE